MKSRFVLACCLLLSLSAAPTMRGQEREEEGGNDGPELLQQEAFWWTRVSYPTGEYDQRWVVRAAEQDRLVPRGVPGGRVTYTRSAQSPLALDPTRFTSLGPQPLQSNGCLTCFPYGHVAGRTNVIAVDPVTPNVAYLGSDGGGVWKTTNCCTTATTWTPVTDEPALSTIAIGDITIDPNDHGVVYAGTGDLRFGSFSFGAAGLLKSTNQGATWTVLGADVFSTIYPQLPGAFPQYQAIGKVKVDPRNSSNVIVGTKTGVFFSYNGGVDWTGPCLPDSFPNQRQDVTGLLVADNGTGTDLYVAVGARGFATPVQINLDQNGANGIYRTLVPASGCPASWTLSSTPANGWPAGTGGGTPFPTNTLGRIDMAMAPSNRNVIYAQVQAIAATPPTQQGGQLGVWRTTDGGTTWEQRSGVAGLTGCDGDYNQNWYDQGLAVDPNNPDVVFMDTHDIWRSTNGGTTFVDLTCGYAGGTSVHVDNHALAFVPGSSSVLLTGSDGGAYVSTNANAASPTFTQISDSLSTIEFYSGDITASFATAAAPGINAGAQDNGSSVFVWSSGNPGPAMWQLRRGGDGMFARIEPLQGLRWYQESQNGSIGVSTTGPNGGQANATGAWNADTRSFVFPYELDKYNCPGAMCEHMIAGTNRVWETLLGAVPASSWRAASPNLTKGTLGARSFINQLAFAFSDTTVAIVGTNDGNVQYGFNLGQAVPGATWVNVTGANAVLPNRPILDVATAPATPTVGYAAVGGFDANTPTTPGHVFQVVCTPGCASFTWTNKSGNLPDIPADSILPNPRFPQQVFVGTDWGLYFTNDVNQNPPVWQRFQQGLPNSMIWDMSIDRGFTTLAVFTRSRGAYAWPLPDGPVPVELTGFEVK
ncbi:MAG TPA: hypothetical protein VFQ51_07810 [Vicinamibacteria bacterium]|nr:hypothetical protein [Vicinamibacteria bacterium]